MEQDEISGEPVAEPILEDELEDFPTLHSVVESGDETIIQTSRIGRDMIRELSAISAYSEPHIHVGQNDTAGHGQGAALLQNLEQKLESIIEKHVSALRTEIGEVLRESLEDKDVRDVQDVEEGST